MPEITGDTENGTSISVLRNDLPQNSYFAIAHEAQTPKIRLAGTAIAATSSVSWMAAAPAGPVKAAKNVPRPLTKAWANTVANGSTSSTSMNRTAIAISVHLTQPGSLVGREWA